MRTARYLVPAVALLLLPALSSTPPDLGDPPARVGRLSFAGGAVSFRPGSVDEWGDATLNAPIISGDQLWADEDSRAEVTVGAMALRLGASTGVEFLALDDSTAQVRLSEGSLQVRLRVLRENEVVEIDTPNGAVSLLRPGTYRIDADSLGDQTTITVRLGEAEVTAGGATFPVRRLQTATLWGTDRPTYDVRSARAMDTWDQWSAARDRRSDIARSARYVSRDMPGYEDLDEYGDWRVTDAYGAVWTPRRVSPGWAPYRYGHWRWVDSWGWTWIDDAPWGFAPFHYGRWVYARGAWGWAPGRYVAVRPVYAPALVVFVGGVEGGVGWFPLAPGEVYFPAYHVSRTYVRNVNVTTVNVTNINITNVDITRVRYANRDAPRGLTLVGRETFVSAQPVARGPFDVLRDRSRMTVVGTAPPVAPTRESVQPRRGEGSERRPPEGMFTRRVVVKRTPPPAPVPFVARERALQDHPGRPVDRATLDELRARAPASERERRVQPGGRSPGTTPTLQPTRRQPNEPRPAPAVTAPREPERRPDVDRAAPTPERRGERPPVPLPRPEPMPPQRPAEPPAAAPQPSQPAGQPPEERRERMRGKPEPPQRSAEPPAAAPPPSQPAGQQPEERREPTRGKTEPPQRSAEPPAAAPRPSQPAGQQPEERREPTRGKTDADSSDNGGGRRRRP